MHTISIRDDIEQVIIQFVRAIPDVFLDYDVQRLELQETAEGVWDIVHVDSEEFETVLGEAILGYELDLSVEIFPA